MIDVKYRNAQKRRWRNYRNYLRYRAEAAELLKKAERSYRLGVLADDEMYLRQEGEWKDD